MVLSCRLLTFSTVLAVPILSGCSATGDTPLASADEEVTARSLAAEQDREVEQATAAIPSPRPGGAAAAAAPIAYADPGGARAAALTAFEESGAVRPVAARSGELDALIAKYAAHYQVPVGLVRRVVERESNFNPAARNRIYWGLMQIRHDTAQTMGYRGSASGLLDAETNLKYAVKYLRGAYITAGGDEDQAVRLYASGYYYHAKAKGLLKETGLRR